MAENTELSISFSEPVRLTFKHTNMTGLAPPLSLGAIATIADESGTVTRSVFLASDGNTAFALDPTEYAHLTYPETAHEGLVEDSAGDDLVVRSIKLKEDPVTCSVGRDHRWKGMLKQWRTAVGTIHRVKTAMPQSDLSQSTERGGSRWVPDAQPMGLSLRELALASSQLMTRSLSQSLFELPSSMDTQEEQGRVSEKYFQVIQAIKPLWD